MALLRTLKHDEICDGKCPSCDGLLLTGPCPNCLYEGEPCSNCSTLANEAHVLETIQDGDIKNTLIFFCSPCANKVFKEGKLPSGGGVLNE